MVATGLMIVPASISAAGYLDSNKIEYLAKIQQLLYNDKFHEAESLTTIMIDKYPDHPIGYLCQAINLTSEMLDREENLYSEQFNQLIETTLSKASNIIDTASASTCAWMCLFSGHAKAYRALWTSHFGSFVEGIKLARQAKSEYQRGLEYDSSLYDLYVGLGLYHYWKSAKAGVLRWVGLFKDEREKGIAELYLAVDSSVISQESARSALILVQLDIKEYDSVIFNCHEMLRKYPDGKALLWPLAKAYFEKKDYRNALSTFRLLRERVATDSGNYFNLIECDYRLYQCYEKLAMDAEAERVARRASHYYKQVPRDIRRRQRVKIDLLRRAAKT